MLRFRPQDADLRRFGQFLFDAGPASFEARDDPGVRVLRSGDFLVRAYADSGGILAADLGRLWRRKTRAPVDQNSRSRIRLDTLRALGVIAPSTPAEDRLVQWTQTATSGATAVEYDGPSKTRRDPQKIETRLRFTARLLVPTSEGPTTPVVGGGGGFTVVAGTDGRALLVLGVWRPIEGPATEEGTVLYANAGEANDAFRDLTNRALASPGGAHAEVTEVSSYLAYYASAATVDQRDLVPVRVFHAQLVRDGVRNPMPPVIWPATDHDITSAAGLPARADGGPALSGPQFWRSGVPDKARRPRAGIWWANVLDAKQKDFGEPKAAAYREALRRTGWTVEDDDIHGPADHQDGLESHWNAGSDRPFGIEKQAAAVYTGHATGEGWLLSNPNDSFLRCESVNGSRPTRPSPKWGQGDLRWILIGACGPLQDVQLYPDFARKPDVFARWTGAFGGLRMLLGYAAAIRAWDQEAITFLQLACEPRATLLQAWFLAAMTHQDPSNDYGAPDGPTTYIGALWAETDADSPQDDRLATRASEFARMETPARFVALWAPVASRQGEIGISL